MKSHVVLSRCILLLLLLLAGSLHAATTVFNGSVNEMWSTADNWSNGFPTDVDKFRIAAELCILDYDAGVAMNGVWEGTLGHLRLVDGAKLSVSQWSIIGYNASGAEDSRHTLEVLGGVYNGGIPETPNNGRIFVGREGYALLIIDYKGRVNLLHQDMEVGNGSGGDGRVELRGGILDCGTRRLRLATNAAAKAQVDFSGGILKQPGSTNNLAEINGWIGSGMITAYNGDGTVIVTQTEEGDMIVKGLHPLNPVPGDGDNIVPGSVTLSWTVEAGTDVDVWIGTKADLSDFKQVVMKKAVTSVAVATNPKQRYLWAVDTYPSGAEEPTWGPVFDFYVDNLAPVVDAADDVTTWVDNGSVDVAIAATVTDGDPTTALWTVVTEPAPGTAVIADASAAATSVTLSAVGTYVLEIAGNDGEYTSTDTLVINVYSDHCEAAKSLPGWTALPGDINLDCVVDQLDMDLLMEQWLNCNGLACPEPVIE